MWFWEDLTPQENRLNRPEIDKEYTGIQCIIKMTSQKIGGKLFNKRHWENIYVLQWSCLTNASSLELIQKYWKS